MSKQWFDVGNAPTLTIACQGNLWVVAQTESSLVVSAEKNESVTVAGTKITAQGDVRIVVPTNSTIILTQAGGNVKIKGVRGGVDTLVPIQGDAVFAIIDGAVTLTNVQGELRVRDLNAPLVVNEVGGDFRAQRIESVRAKWIKGDCLVQMTTSNLSIDRIDGEAAIQNVAGEVALATVGGDCILSELGGIASVNCLNDLRIKGSLALGQHRFSADSSITLLWPAKSSLRVTANAPTIVNQLPFAQPQKSAGQLIGVLGNGNPSLTLISKNRIALRPESASTTDSEEYAEVQINTATISEELKSQLNARLNELTKQLPTQPLNNQVERVLRKAQEVIDQLAIKMEEAIASAEQRAESALPEAKPILKIEVDPETVPPHEAPTKPIAPPKSAETRSAAQLKILELLEKGVISADDAKNLLASLR